MTGYPVVAELPVRFRDTDAMGHVNNAAYLTYLEEARVVLAREHFGVRRVEEMGMILARVEIDYRSPALFGERIRVGLRVSKVGGASFEAEYRVEEAGSRRLLAEARTVQVGYDYRESKVARWDRARRRTLLALQGGAPRLSK